MKINMSAIRKVGNIVGLIIVFLVAVAAGIFLYYRSYYLSTISQAYSESAETASVIIAPGDSVDTIIDKLINSDVVSDKKMIDGNYVFYWYLSLEKIGGSLKAGSYALPKNLNMKELATTLQTTQSQDLWITVREGKRIEEVATAIDSVLNEEENLDKSKFNKVEFIALAQAGTRYTEYAFMEEIPAGKSLEGFLFPDSWLVERDTTAEEVLKMMLQTFEDKIYEPYLEEIEAGDYSLYELVTLASIIEREGRTSQDRPMIADILYRRLETNGWLLEVDATLQYGLGWSEEEQTWWRGDLPDRHTENEYNTSIHDGLPPSPICGFGVESFDSVMNPVENDYWFYIHDNDGVVHYARTYEEHLDNVNEYLR